MQRCEGTEPQVLSSEAFEASLPAAVDPGIAREEEAFRDALVLLVEDNPVNREVALSMLENLGCRVEMATDGLEAVEAASRTRFDLILMDCQMPRMDGYQATELIRQNERIPCREPIRVPIVALTAHAMEGDRHQCLLAGMDDYLTKPFTQEQLRELLERCLKSKGSRGQDEAA
jgi:CheY-like chemotaxis protein